MQITESFSVPVVFIIFNRPETTEKVFSEIMKIKPAQLFIIADGPRSHIPGEKEKCDAVRHHVMNNITWDCQVFTDFSEKNLGCKTRISSGLTWVFSKVEMAIILEDDCVPNHSFFQFSKELLERYKTDERIMMISGSRLGNSELKENCTYYFSRFYHIWGWATWARAWKLYDSEMTLWPKVREKKYLHSVYHDPIFVQYFTKIFDGVYSGKEDTWDAQWFLTCIVHGGVAIVPRKNFITNIGNIGSRRQQALLLNTPAESMDLQSIIHPRIILPDPVLEREDFSLFLHSCHFGYFKMFYIRILQYFHLLTLGEVIYKDVLNIRLKK